MGGPVDVVEPLRLKACWTVGSYTLARGGEGEDEDEEELELEGDRETRFFRLFGDREREREREDDDDFFFFVFFFFVFLFFLCERKSSRRCSSWCLRCALRAFFACFKARSCSFSLAFSNFSASRSFCRSCSSCCLTWASLDSLSRRPRSAASSLSWRRSS